MPNPWEKYSDKKNPWDKYAGVRTTRDPSSPKAILKNKRPLSVIADEMRQEGKTPQEIDAHLIRAWGYDPAQVMRSKNYQPGIFFDAMVKPEDYTYAFGQQPGGTAVLGLGEAVGGPLRQGAKSANWALNKLGVVPDEDKAFGEVLSNIAAENYKFSTTNPETGEGNRGQEAAPVVGQVVLGNKLGPLSRLMNNPVVGGAMFGAAQDFQTRGNGSGGSDFGSGTLGNIAKGGVINSVAGPLIGAGVNKFAGTRLGQELGLMVQDAGTSLESMSRRVTNKLGGKRPGQVLQDALKRNDLDAYRATQGEFARAAQVAPSGDMPMPETIAAVDSAIDALGRKGNPPAALAKLQQFRERLAGNNVDPRPMAKQFKDIMDEYKIFNAEMQQAFDQGGNAGAAGATAGDRGNLLREIKNAMKVDAFRFSPSATIAWDEAGGRFGQYADRFKNKNVLSVVDSAEPEKAISQVVGDKYGDFSRAIGAAAPVEGQTALQGAWLDDLIHKYNNPGSGVTSWGAGPRTVAREINNPELQSSLGVAFQGPDLAAIQDVARRGETANTAARLTNAGVGAVGGALGVNTMGMSHMGGIGGAASIGGGVAAARMLPTWSAPAFYRTLENPQVRQLLSFRSGIPQGASAFQEFLQKMTPEMLTAHGVQQNMEPTQEQY